MGINSIDNVGGVADKTLEITSQRPASSDFASSNKRKTEDIVKFDDEVTETDRELTADFLRKTIDNANKQLLNIDREFSHSVHKKTGQFMVKLIDRKTKEVIREIPPEKTLDIVAKLWELAGIFVDEKK